MFLITYRQIQILIMIKYILRLSIAAFIIIFTYDTINFYLSNSKAQENPLVVVRPKVEVVEKKIVHEPIPEYYSDNVLWYSGLGAAVATSLGVICYCLSAVTSKVKLAADNPQVANGGDDNINKESEKDIMSSISPSCLTSSQESDIKEKPEALIRKQCSENVIQADVDASQNLATIILGENKPEVPEGDIANTESQSATGEMAEDELIVNNSQPQEDSALRHSFLAENLSDQLTENLSAHSEEGLYENSDLLVGSRIILDSEISYKSKNSFPKEVALVSLPEQVLAALSCFQAKSEIGTYPPLLNKDDLISIEKRLENIETKIAQMESSSNEFVKRMEMAETELVDLHEQMYTILTKLEEEQKPNYIIVSQMSMVDETKENENKEVTSSKSDSRLIEYNQLQVDEKEELEFIPTKIHQEKTAPGFHVGDDLETFFSKYTSQKQQKNIYSKEEQQEDCTTVETSEVLKEKRKKKKRMATNYTLK